MLTSSGAGRVHPSARTSLISTYPEPAKKFRQNQSRDPVRPIRSQEKLAKKTLPKPVMGPSPGILLVADDMHNQSESLYIRRGSLGGGLGKGITATGMQLVLFFITPSLALMAATATANSLFFAADITFSLSCRKDLPAVLYPITQD